MADHSVYTHGQIERYLAYIDLPRSPKIDIDFLTALQRHQLSAVPFESLSLHYSSDHRVSIDPEELYEKFVGKGRGGYCMENNTFFSQMLRSLGFDVFNVGARPRKRINGVPQNEFYGWVHMTSIVTFADDSQYMVDVGFGGDGPTQPVPLAPNETRANIAPQMMRLIKRRLSELRHPKQMVWSYQIQNVPGGDWSEMYHFTETEFLPQDFEVMNYWTSHNPQCLWMYQLTIVKMLRRGDQIYGKLILNGADLKQRLGLQSAELLKTCKTESERIEVLEQYFGIALTEEERKGIEGIVTELPSA